MRVITVRIIIDVTESTVNARIIHTKQPNQEQAEALLNLARVAGNYRQYLLGFDRHTPPDNACRWFPPDECVCDASGLEHCEYGEDRKRDVD